MQARNISRLVLLLFVGVCLAAVAKKQLRPPPQADPNTAPPTRPTDAENAGPAASRDKVCVYYLHGNYRCQKCNTIEAYAHEVVTQGFAEALASGRLDWQTINYDQPGSEHYKTDFDLIAPSVVVVRWHDGAPQAWQDCPEVWKYVESKTAFSVYLQAHIQNHLNAVADAGG